MNERSVRSVVLAALFLFTSFSWITYRAVQWPGDPSWRSLSNAAHACGPLGLVATHASVSGLGRAASAALPLALGTAQATRGLWERLRADMSSLWHGEAYPEEETLLAPERPRREKPGREVEDPIEVEKLQPAAGPRAATRIRDQLRAPRPRVVESLAALPLGERDEPLVRSRASERYEL